MLDILPIPPMTCEIVRDRKARCNATMAAEWLDCVSHMEQEPEQDREWKIEQHLMLSSNLLTVLYNCSLGFCHFVRVKTLKIYVFKKTRGQWTVNEGTLTLSFYLLSFSVIKAYKIQTT